MTQLTIILFLVVVGFIALFIWNATNFRSLNSQSKLKDAQLNDAKYWELKYKFEFLVAMVGIITAVVGLLGYNSLKSIEDSVKEDLNSKVDSIRTALDSTVADVDLKLRSANVSVEKLSGNVNSFQSAINTNKVDLNSLNKQQSLLRRFGLNSQSSLKDLEQRIDTLNSRNKVRKEFYLVSLPLKPIKGQDLITIKFSDLVTSTGDRLPIFKKPPIVMAAMSNTVQYIMQSISETELELSINDYKIVNVEEYYAKTYYASFIIYDVN